MPPFWLRICLLTLSGCSLRSDAVTSEPTVWSKMEIFRRNLVQAYIRPSQIDRDRTDRWFCRYSSGIWRRMDSYQRFGETYCPHIQPWGRRQYVPPKRWYLSTNPRGVTTQKININIFTAVRISDLSRWFDTPKYEKPADVVFPVVRIRSSWTRKLYDCQDQFNIHIKETHKKNYWKDDNRLKPKRETELGRIAKEYNQRENVGGEMRHTLFLGGGGGIL
jgi:hypothetical protein